MNKQTNVSEKSILIVNSILTLKQKMYIVPMYV